MRKKSQVRWTGKPCDWYLDGFCCRDLDAGRAWDCCLIKNPIGGCSYYIKKQKK